MDLHDFTSKIAEVTKSLTPQEREELRRIFANATTGTAAHAPAGAAHAVAVAHNDGVSVPEGPTQRHLLLKENYLKQIPRITIHRAKVITKIDSENPGMPRILLRAKAFRYCCETAPLVIQDHELIVGAPNGAPRAGAFSPDISWRWLRDEMDSIGTRAQDPFYLADDDKKVLQEEIFPYWAGKSVDEYCEAQYREAGLWDFRASRMFLTARTTPSTAVATPTPATTLSL